MATEKNFQLKSDSLWRDFKQDETMSGHPFIHLYREYTDRVIDSFNKYLNEFNIGKITNVKNEEIEEKLPDFCKDIILNINADENDFKNFFDQRLNYRNKIPSQKEQKQFDKLYYKIYKAYNYGKISLAIKSI